MHVVFFFFSFTIPPDIIEVAKWTKQMVPNFVLMSQTTTENEVVGKKKISETNVVKSQSWCHIPERAYFFLYMYYIYKFFDDYIECNLFIVIHKIIVYKGNSVGKVMLILLFYYLI